MRTELPDFTTPHLPARITGGYLPRPVPAVCSLHVHNEIELLAVTAGTKTLAVNGKTYTLTPGDCYFINSRVPHETVDLPPESGAALLQFRVDAFHKISDIAAYRHLSYFLANSAEVPFRIFRAEEGESELYKLLTTIRGECNEKKDGYETYMRGYIHLCLGFLYRTGCLFDAYAPLSMPIVEKILPALTYIDENYPEDIPLSGIAFLCRMSEGYFCRQFKAATGTNFVEYLNFVRIHEAEKMLTRSKKTVLEISMAVGFSNVSYFNRLFRRYKKCSPSSYRRAQYLRTWEELE